MSTFGARLAACIEASGTNQAELARRAGISGASVSEWVADHVQPGKVKAEPLLRAAAFLQVNPAWLLTGRGPRHPDGPVIAAEPPAAYAAWPFQFIDRALVAQLRPNERAMLEGAWLAAAQSLGFKLSTRRED